MAKEEILVVEEEEDILELIRFNLSREGYNYSVTDRSVDVQIVGLRRKLGRYGRYIETVRGVGYRFRDRGSTPSGSI